MASIHEEVVVIKLSKLVKSSDENTSPIANNELTVSLEQIVQELVGSGVIVEVEKA